MAQNFLGPLMLDVAGYALTEREKERLRHPAVGGVILFSRNFATKEQLQELVRAIKALKDPSLIVAVDHEGGRVQRFTAGFTRLPAMASLGRLYDREGEKVAEAAAVDTGWVLAAELRALDFDLSFTPVLDLDWNRSAVIGGRSFHHDPKIVVDLATHLLSGMSEGGVSGCGKHYPGHGYATGDSHTTIPVDSRAFAEIKTHDLVVFKEMVRRGIPALMPAHVIYPKIDPDFPAGFSRRWLKDILRRELGFRGLIFSDSLTMAGAAGVGDVAARVKIAAGVGCDILLICNDARAQDEVLAKPELAEILETPVNWDLIRGKKSPEYYTEVMNSADFGAAREMITEKLQKGAIPPPEGLGE